MHRSLLVLDFLQYQASQMRSCGCVVRLPRARMPSLTQEHITEASVFFLARLSEKIQKHVQLQEGFPQHP